MMKVANFVTLVAVLALNGAAHLAQCGFLMHY